MVTHQENCTAMTPLTHISSYAHLTFILFLSWKRVLFYKTTRYQNYCSVFYVHVTVHRNKFLYNKTNLMHQFTKFTPAGNSKCFGQFLCPSSGVYSLCARHWYMSYRFYDSFRAGPGWNCSSILVLLECYVYSACITYTIAECTVNKLLMMDRGTARNM
jgi:hypothetical protein